MDYRIIHWRSVCCEIVSEGVCLFEHGGCASIESVRTMLCKQMLRVQKADLTVFSFSI